MARSDLALVTSKRESGPLAVSRRDDRVMRDPVLPPRALVCSGNDLFEVLPRQQHVAQARRDGVGELDNADAAPSRSRRSPRL